ncbi:glycine-rich domain-containing protein [Noviherbaspirillum sp. ST9]|uniref:glycine-rich domain-containing protein n=1 Tax=Noviherbaspirillum sp. ST9 TaxID=3401606 RepID=UPI003B589EEC
MEHQAQKTPEQMVEAVFSLDLGPIKFKLMDASEGYGWTREEADRRELEYKRFLALVAKYPDEAIVPDKEVDKFWHAHILDTMKYAEDCQHVFGYFLHHFPYFGMRDEEDAVNLANANERTRSLYRQEFGPAAQQGAAYCGVAAAAYCGAAAETASAAYCGVASEKASAAYCGVAAGKAAYCGVAAGKAASAYCGAAKPAYCGVVTAKGRPALDKAAA